MSSSHDKPISEFFRISGPTDKKHRDDQCLTALLHQNNLTRKKIPEGPNSLMRSISDSLYFTTQYHDQIQQSLLRHLSTLIASDTLLDKLSVFKGNSILLKDYTNNPQMSGFEKINLELVSSFFKVKVIVYSMTEDNYLNAMIINKNYDKTIKLLRTSYHYFEPVYPKSFIESAGSCQNILLNMVDHVADGRSEFNFKDLNGDIFINYEYENWLSSKNTGIALDQFRITRSHHKKSFSESFNMITEDQQMKFYNMFVNSNPPDDFLKLFKQQRKDTVESNFSINANFDFMDEPLGEAPLNQNNSYFKKRRASSMDFLSKDEYPEISSLAQPAQNNDENLAAAFLQDKTDDALNFPGLFPNISLGFSRNRSTRPDQIQLADFEKDQTIVAQNERNENSNSPAGSLKPKKALSLRPFLLSTQSSEFVMSSSPSVEPEESPALFGQNKQNLAGSPGQKEKKKPIIIDEGFGRYSGRLKFFDEAKNYGFIVMDDDGSDIFVHYDDLLKANVDREVLRMAKAGQVIRLSFSCMKYIGKYDKSRKAIDIQVL